MYERTYWRLFVKVAYVLLGFAAVCAITAGTVLGAKDVRVETREVAQAIESYAELEAALGEPAQTIPGAQLNPNLEGATCGVWQLGQALVIGCK